MKVAIAGFGTIGRAVGRALDQGVDGLALVAVSARDVAKAERAMAGVTDFVRSSMDERSPTIRSEQAALT